MPRESIWTVERIVRARKLCSVGLSYSEVDRVMKLRPGSVREKLTGLRRDRRRGTVKEVLNSIGASNTTIAADGLSG